MPKLHPSAIERLADLENVELVIAKLVSGGDGLGFFDGIPIFVPRTAPGDRVRVHLTERKPDYARGLVEEILEPGPDRVDPRCRHFNDCGGCDLQHLGYDAQVRAKVEAAAETLVRLGGIRLPTDRVRVVRGDPWGYRMRTTLHRQAPANGDLGGSEVGYRAARSHRLVPVEECPILVPELERVVRGLPESVLSVDGRRIDLAAGSGGRITAAPAGDEPLRGPVEVRVAAYRYQFDARCFFQAHRGLLPELVKAVVGVRGEVEATDTAVDLYAGVGLFTLPLAAEHRRVIAVDSDRIATRYLKRNARDAQLDNIEVVTQSVDTWVRMLPAADRLIVDPPRSGLSPYLRSVIRRRQIPRLTYVSCHPATLARDLAGLEHYEIEEVVFLDQFPHSGHLEVVVQARLKSAA